LIVDTRMLFGDTNGSPYLHAPVQHIRNPSARVRVRV
jgi:hypothetical protein